MAEVSVFPDSASLALAAAEMFVESCQRALMTRGVCSVALAGGTTPQAVYTLLGKPEYVERLSWEQMHIFWGDERMVPPDDPESNYQMAWQAMLRRAPLPPENIHRIRGELNPTEAAETYNELLQAHFGGPPQAVLGFDLLMLGMGVDGHVASLFPGEPALEEDERWAVAVSYHQPPPPLLPRVSLTLPAINSTRQVMVLVTGEHKAATLHRVLAENVSGELLPAQRVQPRSGRLVWMVDQAAMSAGKVGSGKAAGS